MTYIHLHSPLYSSAQCTHINYWNWKQPCFKPRRWFSRNLPVSGKCIPWCKHTLLWWQSMAMCAFIALCNSQPGEEAVPLWECAGSRGDVIKACSFYKRLRKAILDAATKEKNVPFTSRSWGWKCTETGLTAPDPWVSLSVPAAKQVELV